MSNKQFVLQYKRKREGKTHYISRLSHLKSGKHRAVIRASLKHCIIQLTNYTPTGDVILVSAHTNELKKYGWKAPTGNVPAAYLCGYLLAKKAQRKKLTEAIADIGLQKKVKGARLFAAIKGMIDGGMNIPASKDVLPKEDRINGEHIKNYATQLSKDKQKYEKTFSQYLKQGVSPTELANHVKEVKAKLK